MREDKIGYQNMFDFRFDTDRWQPRTLEREKKRMVEEIVEKREKSDLPESTVDIDEVFSGRYTFVY